MTSAGTFRLYFNRHGAAPLTWCVATDEWELAIEYVNVEGCDVYSVYKAKDTPDDEDGKPSAWFEVTGRLFVEAGVATIRGDS